MSQEPALDLVQLLAHLLCTVDHEVRVSPLLGDVVNWICLC